MLGNRSRPRIPLPRQWSKKVRSGVLHAISLAHYSLTFTRGWAANGFSARIRLNAETTCAYQKISSAVWIPIPAPRRGYSGTDSRLIRIRGFPRFVDV